MEYGGIMNFEGPEEYYFYKGVKFAHNSTNKDLALEVSNLISFECRVADGCREAFILGYDFGLAVPEEDYKDLTKTENPVIKKSGVILKKKKDKKPDVLDKEYTIKGNC